MRAAWILILTLYAAAQSIPETEAARALRLLHAPGWQDKAWGAYFAGRLHSDAMREPLIDALREAAALRDERPGADSGSYLATLFDAAIETRIAVPAAILRPFELSQWRAQVIILLSFGKDNEEALLNLRTEKLTNIEWLAVSNQLNKLQSQRFYVKVLGEIVPTHEFMVNDPGTGGGHGGGIIGSGYDVGPGRPAPGFPPTAIYSLIYVPQPGDVLLVGGPRDVFYRRVISPGENRSDSGIGQSFDDRQEILTAYLAPLGKRSREETARIFHAQTQLEFHDDAELLVTVESAMKQQEGAIRGFLHEATAKGVGYAGTGVKIEVQFDDHRKARTPLPKFPPHEFVLN